MRLPPMALMRLEARTNAVPSQMVRGARLVMTAPNLVSRSSPCGLGISGNQFEVARFPSERLLFSRGGTVLTHNLVEVVPVDRSGESAPICAYSRPPRWLSPGLVGPG